MPRTGSSALYRKAKAILGCAMTTAVVGVGTAAVAPVASADAMVDQFEVWNLTSTPVTLYQYEQNPGIDVGPRAPKVGTVIVPGTMLHFGLDWRFDEELRPRFQNTATQQNWRVEVRPGKSASSRMTCAGLSGPNANCSPPIGNDKNVVALWDGVGTRVAIPPGDAQKRADVLNNLCTNGYAPVLDIKCDYTEMSDEAAHTPRHMPTDYGPVEAGNVPMSTTATWTDKVATTTSFTASASATAKVWGIINVALQAQYQKTVTQEHTFQQSVGITVDPHNKGYICVSQALIHYSGTLKVTVPGTRNPPNTTWLLPGVTVDAPDPGGHPEFYGFEIPATDVVPGDACLKKQLISLAK